LTIQGQAFETAAVQAPTLPIEIAFLLQRGVSHAALHRAAAAARRIGCTSDEALIKLNLLDEETYYRALAAEMGFAFLESDFAVSPQTRFPDALLLGMARLARETSGPDYVLAPAGLPVGWMLSRRRPFGRGFAIATPTALTRAVLRSCGAAIARSANALADAEPHRSYRGGASRAQKAAGLSTLACVVAAAAFAPRAALACFTVLSGLTFLAMVTVRLGAAREAPPVRPIRPSPRASDEALPTYTVIVPMRREHRVLPRLVASLRALDYPPPKLQAIIAIEADDHEMAAALSGMRLPAHFEVLVAPPGEPRTKPRALNIALAIARGEFVTVYDAEDVPSPDQLRLAVAAFAQAPANVACLQARLVIDNTDDNWLTRFFTTEYATLFDAINPGLAALDLPVPLGGTSNHFRTAVLRELHGWDAFNVTEDADLGIRLALAGYRVRDLPSATLEEAPSSWKPWFGQRIRWMKGFMQVVITHSRHPGAALKALGARRFLAAVTLTLGTVAAALGYPIFTLVTLLAMLNGTWLAASTLPEAFMSGLGLTLFSAGLAAMTVPAVIGLKRRRWWRLLPYVPLLPLYYGLVSIAAWQAVIELMRHPFRWHKTEHGFARTSRTGLLNGGAPADGGRD
jgi:cellulose synthase/poly-beta-1,6-N-acetylglucosamine synthase-like glycosyltransferase